MYQMCHIWSVEVGNSCHDNANKLAKAEKEESTADNSNREYYMYATTT